MTEIFPGYTVEKLDEPQLALCRFGARLLLRKKEQAA